MNSIKNRFVELDKFESVSRGDGYALSSEGVLQDKMFFARTSNGIYEINWQTD